MYTSQICPRCGGARSKKDGSVRGNKRYRCSLCNYRFTLPIHKIGPDLKRKIILFYLEGFSTREIGNILKISHVSATKIIKEELPDGAKLRKNDKPELFGTEKIKTLLSSNNKGPFMLAHEEIAYGINGYLIIGYAALPLDKKTTK
jgi:transposase-like protein